MHATDTIEEGSYTLASDVEAAAYWLGIPVRRWRLRSTVTLQPGRGLVRQRITFDDGGFAVVEVLDDGRSGGLSDRIWETGS